MICRFTGPQIHKSTQDGKADVECHSALWTVNRDRIGRGSPSRVAKGCILDAARACEFDVAAQLALHEPRNEAWGTGRVLERWRSRFGANRKMSARQPLRTDCGPCDEGVSLLRIPGQQPQLFPSFSHLFPHSMRRASRFVWRDCVRLQRNGQY